MLADLLSQISGLNSGFLFTAVYCFGLVSVVVLEHPEKVRYLRSPLSEVSRTTLTPIPHFRMTPGQFHLVGFLTVVSLLLAGTWTCPRLTLLSAACCVAVYYRPVIEMNDVLRKPMHVIFVLIGLAFLPDWELTSHDRAYPYVLPLVLIILAQMYFSSALEKLRHSGLKWVNGYTLRAFFRLHCLMYGEARMNWIARQSLNFHKFMSALTLAFEATFWLSIVFHCLVPIYAIAGISFHLFKVVFMRIHYLRLAIWSYIGILLVYWQNFLL
jgi:hypothetical protein